MARRFTTGLGRPDLGAARGAEGVEKVEAPPGCFATIGDGKIWPGRTSLDLGVVAAAAGLLGVGANSPAPITVGAGRRTAGVTDPPGRSSAGVTE